MERDKSVVFDICSFAGLNVHEIFVALFGFCLVSLEVGPGFLEAVRHGRIYLPLPKLYPLLHLVLFSCSGGD
jgi:hypothetical protein